MNNIAGWIERHADFQPDKSAFIYGGKRISYADFAKTTGEIATVLHQRLNVGRGDRVAFLGLNSPDMVALMFACAKVGAIFLPLNWRLTAPELTGVMHDAGAEVLFCTADFQSHAEAIDESLTHCSLVAIDFSARGWHELGALSEGVSGSSLAAHGELSDPLLLVYTSGSTGEPKGALLTQEAVQWNALNSLHMHGLCGDDLVLSLLPMFHVGGLNILTSPALYIGATVLMQAKFEPQETLAYINEYKPSLVVLVPAIISALAALPQWESTDWGCFRAVSTGSCHVPHAQIKLFHTLGVPVIQVYGATETGPIACYLAITDAFDRVGSVGKSAMHCQVRVVGDDGREPASGEAGEILVKGPNVMREYWQNSQASHEALKDGWFHTGDVGYCDEAGFYYVTDRKKDMIISGGENIYPAELEQLLSTVDGVVEAAVVGRADSRWGEVPIAVVVGAPDCVQDREAILQAFEGKVARFKCPQDVFFVDSLPRNAMGKVLKNELRELVAERKC